MRINVSRLQYLLQISRSGGVLAAADAMKLTASAVSQQLRRLEAEVGVPLMDRRPDGILPTPAGRELIELAENVEREINEAALRVGAVSELPSGLVRFGGFQSFISAVLSPALPLWPSRLAGVRLEIAEVSQPALLRGLRAAEFDIIAIESDESEEATASGPGVQEVALFDDPWVLAAPAGTHAAMGVIDLDELRLPWLDVDAQTGAARAVSRVRKHLPRSATAPHRYTSHESALSLVAAGEGVALLPLLTTRERTLAGVELHELPGLGVRHVSLRYREGRKSNPVIGAVVEFIRTLVASGGALQDHSTS
ncbi:LysR family transcriptional regulator [Leucobacter weissii]|uniref:LysR family transcriptional regulator n=1 Tax=Leucobacter weissii TaxID=1983706 RepID=A0A939MKZ7_9MICO|nr:LysR family transcriptional regulator [Leucobacter weissii]MBO1900351.1 LysR family transcriptional regulator [Leucobacter weissii]